MRKTHYFVWQLSCGTGCSA